MTAPAVRKNTGESWSENMLALTDMKNPRILPCLSAFFIMVLFNSCATRPPSNGVPDVLQRHDLENHPLASVFETLGRQSISDHTRRASELGGEFYVPITARFPPNDPASAHIFIREVRWEHGDHYIAVFCQKQRGTWIVFDAVEWRKDIMF